MSHSSLAGEWIPAYQGNYTVGRGGRAIRAITVHHMAARWTARRCGESFQQIERDASSHYGIGFDGEIAQYVDEKDTAWTNGNWDSNLESVTIECANSASGAPWPVSDASLQSLTSLIADIARRNGLVPLVKGVNLTWHGMFEATACPGAYLLSKMDEIVEEANRLLTGEETERIPVTLSYGVFTDRWLPEVSGASVGDDENGFAGILGQPVTAVIASASRGSLFYQTHLLGGEWLPEVMDREDFAGIFGCPVDGFMIRSDETLLHYRVHTLEDGWLPEVTGYDPSDGGNGFAGILGHTVDGLLIRADGILIQKAPPAAAPLPEDESPAETESFEEEVPATPPLVAEPPFETVPPAEKEPPFEERKGATELLRDLLLRVARALSRIFLRND